MWSQSVEVLNPFDAIMASKNDVLPDRRLESCCDIKMNIAKFLRKIANQLDN